MIQKGYPTNSKLPPLKGVGKSEEDEITACKRAGVEGTMKEDKEE